MGGTGVDVSMGQGSGGGRVLACEHGGGGGRAGTGVSKGRPLVRDGGGKDRVGPPVRDVLYCGTSCLAVR